MESSTLQALEQRQRMACMQFYGEAEVKRKELGLSEPAVQMALLYMCGMPSWDALKTVAADHPELLQQLASSPILIRTQAEEILRRKNVREFLAWARVRSTALEALAMNEYTWSFRDSEHELRFIIAQCEYTMKQAGIANAQVMSTMTGAVRELNSMFQFASRQQTAGDTAKQVIFEGESELED